MSHDGAPGDGCNARRPIAVGKGVDDGDTSGAGVGAMQPDNVAELFTPAALTRAEAARLVTLPVLPAAAAHVIPGRLSQAVTAEAYVTEGTGAGGLSPTPRPTAIAMMASATATPTAPHLHAGAQPNPFLVLPYDSARGSTEKMTSLMRPPVGTTCKRERKKR